MSGSRGKLMLQLLAKKENEPIDHQLNHNSSFQSSVHVISPRIFGNNITELINQFSSCGSNFEQIKAVPFSLLNGKNTLNVAFLILRLIFFFSR